MLCDLKWQPALNVVLRFVFEIRVEFAGPLGVPEAAAEDAAKPHVSHSWEGCRMRWTDRAKQVLPNFLFAACCATSSGTPRSMLSCISFSRYASSSRALSAFQKLRRKMRLASCQSLLGRLQDAVDRTRPARVAQFPVCGMLCDL